MSRYVSNGTMGDMWLHHWCYRCANDHDFSHGSEWGDGEDGCEILARLYTDNENIPELTDNSGAFPWGPDQLVCRMFSPCQKCNPGGGDDKPKPIDPGPDHGVLFEVVDAVDAVPMFIIPVDHGHSRELVNVPSLTIGPDRDA